MANRHEPSNGMALLNQQTWAGRQPLVEDCGACNLSFCTARGINVNILHRHKGFSL